MGKKKKVAKNTKKSAGAKASAGESPKAPVKKNAVKRGRLGEAEKKRVLEKKTGGAAATAKTAPASATECPPGFPIVGIGASAGGLEALVIFPTKSGQ